MELFDYNIFVSTENGLLKGINSKTKTFQNLNNLENLSKEKEIFKMCWSNESTQDTILFGTKDNHIVRYKCRVDVDDNPFADLGCFDLGRGILKGLESISDDKLLTCVESGCMKLWSLGINGDNDNETTTTKLVNEIKVGSDIHCVKKSKFSTSEVLVATGGKENDLKIWDVNSTNVEPLFKAKNVADNWMQLREAIWIMSIDFIAENRVAIGTAYHQLRVYDTKCGARKPVFNLNYGNHPITSICSIPNDSNRILVGNTRGDMEMIDLRLSTNKNGQCTPLKKYKSFQGTIKSIDVTSTNAYGQQSGGLYVATCGLDRFLRVHNVETSQLVSKIYVKSRSNCLLFSKHEPVSKIKVDRKKNKGDENEEEDRLSNVNSEDLGTDDLWSDMETIVEEHPSLVDKKSKRLKDFSSQSESDQSEDDDQDEEETKPDESEFKKPKKDANAREVKENIVVNDIIDNYCIFNKLEQYMYNPIRLKEQLLYQISNEISNKLIEKYYKYDSNVVREILGHKLTQRQRKDLDDVCEKTDVRVKSCRRQFDNLKRIIRATEDTKGSLVKSIMENFYLPNKMAEEYSAIVFLTKNQFELSKKKLNHLSLDDFIYCANQIIKNWSNSQESECDFSRDFLINLKDLRLLVEKDFIEDHKKMVISGVCRALSLNKESRTIQTLEYSFKDLSKALMEIAYALNHSKDMKDLFYDLEEKFIEPCMESNLGKSEVKAFLEEYMKKAHQLQDICRDNPKYLTVFDRYMITISNCILQMYHS